jgi:hypothetical protein
MTSDWNGGLKHAHQTAGNTQTRPRANHELLGLAPEGQKAITSAKQKYASYSTLLVFIL